MPLRALWTRQFVIFVAVGVTCAVVDVGTFHWLSTSGVHPVIATTAGYVLSILLNFALHMRLTFTAKWSRGTIWRYLATWLINYGISVVFVLTSEALLADPLPGKIVSLPVIAVNGFFLCKKWVFR